MTSIDRYRAVMWPILKVEQQVQFERSNESTLVEGLWQLREHHDLCDITLVFQGLKFSAHKAVLAATSEYFRSMFTINMKEKNSSEIDLSKSLLLNDPKMLEKVLFFLYTGKVQMDVDNAEDFIRTADFLLLAELKDFCQEFYLNHVNLHLSNCLHIGAMAERHHMPRLSLAARNILCARFHDHILFSNEVLDVPVNMLVDILQDSTVTQFSQPDDVARCLLKWVQHDEGRSEHWSKLLKFIDFSLLSPDVFDLYQGISESKSKSHVYAKLKSLNKATKKLLKDFEDTVAKSKNSENSRGQSQTSEHTDDSQECSQDERSKRQKLNMAESEPGTSATHHDTSARTNLLQSSKPAQVIVCINTNPFLKYMRLLIYNIQQQQWLSLHLGVSELIYSIPGTQTIGAASLHGRSLFILVSYFIPFPQNFATPIVIEYDLITGLHRQLAFSNNDQLPAAPMNNSLVRTFETTLVDCKRLPPAFAYCGGQLCIAGNVNGEGHIYVCDTESETFRSYHIPGTRFISKARFTVKDNRFLYIWCRHRYGNEDVHFQANIKFAVFDVATRQFRASETPPPTGISYYSFESPHLLCTEGGKVVMHTPGKSSLVLDELNHKWVPYPYILPAFPRYRSVGEMPYQGSLLCTHCDDTAYILQNPAIYTTSMFSLKPGQSSVTRLLPPPLDGVNVVASGFIPETALASMERCNRFDGSFTKAIMNPEHQISADTDDSTGAQSDLADSEADQDGYLFDDDI